RAHPDGESAAGGRRPAGRRRAAARADSQHHRLPRHHDSPRHVRGHRDRRQPARVWARRHHRGGRGAVLPRAERLVAGRLPARPPDRARDLPLRRVDDPARRVRGPRGRAALLDRHRRPPPVSSRRVLRQVGIYAGLTPFLVIALFPVVWMIITAFKHEQDLYAMKFPLWFHMPPTLKHFRLLFTQTWFGTWVINTALVSVLTVAITLAASVPAAYALTRLRLPGAHGTGVAIFLTYLVPSIVLFIPL